MQYDELSSALGFVSLLPNAPAPPEPTVAPAAPASAPTKSKKSSKPAAAPPAAPVAPAGPVKRDDTGPLPELVGNKNFPGCEANGKFFVTTAISYTNGAHLECLLMKGHSFELRIEQEAIRSSITALARCTNNMNHKSIFPLNLHIHMNVSMLFCSCPGSSAIAIVSFTFFQACRTLATHTSRSRRTCLRAGTASMGGGCSP